MAEIPVQVKPTPAVNPASPVIEPDKKSTIISPGIGETGTVIVTLAPNGSKIYTSIITGEVIFPGKYIQLLAALYSANKGDQVIIKIASPGGMVETGVAILTAIENTRAEVTTVAMGLVASIASIIWLAGHKRILMPASTLMIHGPSGLQAGKVSDIKEECEQIEQYFTDMVTKLTKGVLTEEQLKRVLEQREDLFLPASVLEAQMKGSGGEA